MKKFSHILVIVMIMFTSKVLAQAQYVGIPSTQMNYYSASQKNSQWCWAASIQMVLNYYDVAIQQEQIVARTYGVDPYGRLPNWTGSFQAITANLNNWNIDNKGKAYTVMSSLNWNAPTPTILLQELSQGRPVIIGYKTGANSAHAVVITAASYIQSPMGPKIQTIVVRDPWPSNQNIMNQGRVEYPANILASKILAHWYIKVKTQKIDSFPNIPKKTPKKNKYVKKTYYTSGQLKSRVWIINGKKEGVEKIYTKSGNTKIRITYKNGLKNGIEEEYYDTGQLKRRTEYKDGLKNGIEKIYSKKRLKILKKNNYKDGILLDK